MSAHILFRAGAHSAKVNRAHCPAQRLLSPGNLHCSPYPLPAPMCIRLPQRMQVRRNRTAIHSTARHMTLQLTVSPQVHRKSAPRMKTLQSRVCTHSMLPQASMCGSQEMFHRASARSSIRKSLPSTGVSSVQISGTTASLCTIQACALNRARQS